MNEPLRHIFAMGGGGFLMEFENPLLDEYILGLADQERPKIFFFGTASGDAQEYIDRFYSCFKRFDCTPSHLSLFRGSTSEIEKVLLDQDILYVGGGNTRNFLTLWKDWGVNSGYGGSLCDRKADA